MDWLKHCGSGTIRVLGPAFVALALGLIGSVVYIYFEALLPYYAPAGLLALRWQPLAWLHLAIALFLVVNIFYNYAMVVLTRPGSPPEPAPELADQHEALRKEPAPARGTGFSRYCKQCMIIISIF